MSGEIAFRQIERSDTPEILELLKIGLGDAIPRTREFWEWKHYDNPFGESPGVAAINPEGQLVGLRVMMQWRWRRNENLIRSVRAVDTVTHPDWRGRGMFRNLTANLVEQLKVAKYQFIFNTPNQKSLPGYLKLGWKKVTRVPLLVKPLKPFRAIKTLFSETKQGPESKGTTQIVNLLESPDLKSLQLNPDSDSRIHTDRSPEYLQWRYANTPGLTYDAKFIQSTSGAALAIYRERPRRSFTELSISELLLGPSRDSIPLAANLLKGIGRESNADYMVAISGGGTAERSSFRHAGFFPTGSIGPVLTARNLTPDPSDESLLLQWKNWRCSLGDLELF